MESIQQQLAERESARYTVRLHFAELEDLAEGERVFDVSINGQQVLENFDICKQAGGPWRALVREVPGVTAEEEITIAFSARKGRPCISGVEIVPQR